MREPPKYDRARIEEELEKVERSARESRIDALHIYYVNDISEKQAKLKQIPSRKFPLSVHELDRLFPQHRIRRGFAKYSVIVIDATSMIFGIIGVIIALYFGLDLNKYVAAKTQEYTRIENRENLAVMKELDSILQTISKDRGSHVADIQNSLILLENSQKGLNKVISDFKDYRYAIVAHMQTDRDVILLKNLIKDTCKELFTSQFDEFAIRAGFIDNIFGKAQLYGKTLPADYVQIATYCAVADEFQIATEDRKDFKWLRAYPKHYNVIQLIPDWYAAHVKFLRRLGEIINGNGNYVEKSHFSSDEFKEDEYYARNAARYLDSYCLGTNDRIYGSTISSQLQNFSDVLINFFPKIDASRETQ